MGRDDGEGTAGAAEEAASDPVDRGERVDHLDCLTRDVGYLTGRTREILDQYLDHKMLEAQTTWPKGANGPIAVAAYEALADRVREAVFMLKAMLVRVEQR